MLEYLRTFDWKTFGGVLLFWYFLPIFVVPEIMLWILHAADHRNTANPSLLHTLLVSVLIVWCVVAPVGCGYCVARFARQLPQLTNLLAVTIGFLLQTTRTDYFGWKGNIAWLLLSFGGGALGFFVRRLQMRGRT